MFKSRSLQAAVVEASVLQVAAGELHLVRFAHGEVDIPVVAVRHPHVVEGALSEVRPHQFAVNKFHPVKGAFGKRDVREIALAEYHVGDLCRFEGSVYKGDVAETALFDGAVRSINARFHVFGESKLIDRLFFLRQLFQRLAAFRQFVDGGRGDAYGGGFVGSCWFHRF